MGELLHFTNSSLLVVTVEREVNYDFPDIVATYPLVAAIIIVLPVNFIIIFWVKVIKDKTMIDDMILYDCIANIGFLSSFAFVHPTRIWGDDIFCCVQLAYRSFFAYFNRSIPITIVVYRYIMVCQVDIAEKIGKARLGKILNIFTFLIPLVLCLPTHYFREDKFVFLQCLGREEDFYYNTDDFFLPVIREVGIRQPLYHPFRLVTNLVIYIYTIVVPVGYYKIYKFIKKHNLQVKGK